VGCFAWIHNPPFSVIHGQLCAFAKFKQWATAAAVPLNPTRREAKVMQEVITAVVFAVFSTLYMRQPVNWNYAIAGLCLVVAAFFMFRGITHGA